jgi:hypothetical protein
LRVEALVDACVHSIKALIHLAAQRAHLLPESVHAAFHVAESLFDAAQLDLHAVDAAQYLAVLVARHGVLAEQFAERVVHVRSHAVGDLVAPGLARFRGKGGHGSDEQVRKLHVAG